MPRRRPASLLAAAATLAGVARAAAPLAQHVTAVVEPGGDVVVTLRGYDVDGDALRATVASLPATGALAQLSKVYSKFDYDPKKGNAATAGAPVTGTRNRLYYARPRYDAEPSTGKWGSFSYTVSDGSSTSKAGTVTLVPPSLKLVPRARAGTARRERPRRRGRGSSVCGVFRSGLEHLPAPERAFCARPQVASGFDASNEGWTVVRNGPGTTATHDASSFGAGLNRFVVATDELIARDGSTNVETNASRWMFSAPSAFSGPQGAAYGGTLEFTLGALAGDLSTPSTAHNLVELECATCDASAGITLAFPVASAAAFDGSTTKFALSLSETAGWIKDPKNTLLAWGAPSKCEMVEVLSGLTGLRILGDFTDWYESVALDDVSLKVPASGKSAVPTCAQGTPDASVCTCA